MDSLSHPYFLGLDFPSCRLGSGARAASRRTEPSRAFALPLAPNSFASSRNRWDCSGSSCAAFRLAV